MDVPVVALIVSSLGVSAGLVTLALVIRNELRERRRTAPVVWGFHKFASATVDGVACEAAELVQYGRMPTHLMNYTPVGFGFHFTAEARMRRYVKAEDTMPLFLINVDPDYAWLLLLHYPRDDRRFVYCEYVDLDPTSDKYRDRVVAAREKLRAGHKTWRGRLKRLKWRIPGRSIVRPVGPDGYQWARIRTTARRLPDEAGYEEIFSLATAAGAKSYTPY